MADISRVLLVISVGRQLIPFLKKEKEGREKRGKGMKEEVGEWEGEVRWRKSFLCSRRETWEPEAAVGAWLGWEGWSRAESIPKGGP